SSLTFTPAITHHAPKRGARLRGNDDEIDGAVLLDLLLGTLGREEGGEEKPQHEGGDGEQGNRRENFAEMKGHVSCHPFARRGKEANRRILSRLTDPGRLKTRCRARLWGGQPVDQHHPPDLRHDLRP